MNPYAKLLETAKEKCEHQLFRLKSLKRNIRHSIDPEELREYQYSYDREMELYVQFNRQYSDILTLFNMNETRNK